MASNPCDTTVHIWSASSGIRLYTYEGHTESVNAFAWTLEGAWLASGDLDVLVHVSPAYAEGIDASGKHLIRRLPSRVTPFLPVDQQSRQWSVP